MGTGGHTRTCSQPAVPGASSRGTWREAQEGGVHSRAPSAEALASGRRVKQMPKALEQKRM